MKKLIGYYSGAGATEAGLKMPVDTWSTHNEKRAIDRGLCVWGACNGHNFSVVIPWTDLVEFVNTHTKKGSYKRGK